MLHPKPCPLTTQKTPSSWAEPPPGFCATRMLGCSRRYTLVLDAAQSRNRFACPIHGVLGPKGLDPASLLERGRAEIRSKGIEHRRAEGRAATRRAGILDGKTLSARVRLHTRGITVLEVNLASTEWPGASEHAVTTSEDCDPRDALVARGNLAPHDATVSGLDFDRAGTAGRSFRAVDHTDQTSHPRIWAAGNVVNSPCERPPLEGRWKHGGSGGECDGGAATRRGRGRWHDAAPADQLATGQSATRAVRPCGLAGRTRHLPTA